MDCVYLLFPPSAVFWCILYLDLNLIEDLWINGISFPLLSSCESYGEQAVEVLPFVLTTSDSDFFMARLLHLVKKKKKTTQVILCALCPLLCNSMLPQHTLQMFTDHCSPRQTIQWETINQGLLQPQGELYPIQTIFNHRSQDQLLEFRTSFYVQDN